MDSLVQATLPPGPVEDEVDTYEALALAGRVSELSNKATPEHSDFVIDNCVFSEGSLGDLNLEAFGRGVPGGSLERTLSKSSARNARIPPKAHFLHGSQYGG